MPHVACGRDPRRPLRMHRARRAPTMPTCVRSMRIRCSTAPHMRAALAFLLEGATDTDAAASVHKPLAVRDDDAPTARVDDPPPASAGLGSTPAADRANACP